MPPLIALHGFAGQPALWDALFVETPGHAPHLPGHGFAPCPTPFDWNHAVRAVAPSAPAVWVGYSMGARLAMAAAQHCPTLLTALVLVGGHPGLVDTAAREQRHAWEQQWATRLRNHGLPAFMDAWSAQPLFASQARLDATVQATQAAWRHHHDPLDLAEAFVRLGLAHQPDRRPALAGLDCPVLVVAGEHDTKYQTIGRELARLGPHISFATIPESGHNPLLEQPQATQRTITDWLRATL